MSTSSELSTTTIHSLADTIVTLPYQLGYRPVASLVMMCLRNAADRPPGVPTHTQRGSVVMTARIDLAPVEDHPDVLVALEPALARRDTDLLVLVAFEDGAAAPHDARALLSEVQTLAGAHGVAVVAQARVRGSAWTPADRADGSDHWQQLPQEADVRAVSDYVLAGRAPARDRRALEEVLDPVDHALAREVSRRFESLPQPRDGADRHREAAMTRAAATIGLVVRWTGTGPPELSTDDLVLTTLALDDVRFRDAVLQCLTTCLPVCEQDGERDRADSSQAVGPDPLDLLVSRELQHDGDLSSAACFRLARAAAYIPRTRSAAWLTLVGYLAWRVGEGALANIAIVAARGVDPDYPLAQLVDLALRGAVRPPAPV